MPSKQPNAWAMNLKDTLLKWFQKQGLDPRDTLHSWGIDSDAIYEIITRGCLTGKMEVYAIIFHKTGLKESDPRHRPFTQKAKPWSEFQWQQWLSKQQAQTTTDAPSQNRKPAAKSFSRVDIRPEDALALFNAGIAGVDLGVQMRVLVAAIKAQGATQNQRNGIAQKYVDEILALARTLDAFTQSEEQREQALFLSGVFTDEHS